MNAAKPESPNRVTNEDTDHPCARDVLDSPDPGSYTLAADIFRHKDCRLGPRRHTLDGKRYTRGDTVTGLSVREVKRLKRIGAIVDLGTRLPPKSTAPVHTGEPLEFDERSWQEIQRELAQRELAKETASRRSAP